MWIGDLLRLWIGDLSRMWMGEGSVDGDGGGLC